MPYFSLTEADREAMLRTIGTSSVDDLFADIPIELRDKATQAFGEIACGLSEFATSRLFNSLAAKNRGVETASCFLGAGNYDHYVPFVVSSLASRGEFVTAYTPYQAETSQGTLQVIYEFQTLLCRLTGMEMANASLYDGATALAEALIMAKTATRRAKFLLPRGLSPAYRRVAETYTQGLPVEIEELPVDELTGQIDFEALQVALKNNDVAAVVLAQPNFFGVLEEAQDISDATHEAGALLISVFNPLTLGILPHPASYNADIAVGDGQSIGLPLSFGGPGLGLFCCKEKFSRLAPGRLVGLTVDADGKRGFTLTLQTREQHIRREKATSNICSNQALCALVATIYLTAMGQRGVREAAFQSYQKAEFARAELQKLEGVELVFSGAHFHEFALRLPVPVKKLNAFLKERGIMGPYDLGQDYPGLDQVALFCCTEKRLREEIESLVSAVRDAITSAKTVYSNGSDGDLKNVSYRPLNISSSHFSDEASAFHLDW